MRLAAAVAIALATGGDTSPPGATESSHDTLYGIVVTAVVTLFLGYLTYRSNSRNRNVPPQGTYTNTSAADPRDAEIVDLKKQRDALQVKYDNSQTVVAAQGLEIARLREMIVRLDENPDARPPHGPTPSGRPMPS